MRDIYAHVLEMLRAGEKGVLVTIIEVSGSAPRHPGSKMVVHPDGRIFASIGGGKLEADVTSSASQIFGASGPVQRTYQLTEDEGMWCGGSVKILFEPFGQQERLIVFGAGHIGQALSPLAAKAGFRVTVVDNRSEYASRDRFPDADDVIAGEYSHNLSHLEFDPQTYIVIVTHGHKHDEEILSYCIHQPFAYLGVIGSKNKTRTMMKHLQERGVDPNRLARIHSPIGLKIGAETPFEIAVSILAEMIAVKRGVSVDALSMNLP